MLDVLLLTHKHHPTPSERKILDIKYRLFDPATRNIVTEATITSPVRLRGKSVAWIFVSFRRVPVYT